MYFPNVNLLRAFAALLVLVYHVIELAPWPDFPTAGALLIVSRRLGRRRPLLRHQRLRHRALARSGSIATATATIAGRSCGAGWRASCRSTLSRCAASSCWSSRRAVAAVGEARAADRQPPPVPAQPAPVRCTARSMARTGAWRRRCSSTCSRSLAVPLLSRLDVRWLLAGGVLVAWSSRALAFWAHARPRQPECHVRLRDAGSRRCSMRSRSASASRGCMSTERWQRWTARFGALPLLRRGMRLRRRALFRLGQLLGARRLLGQRRDGRLLAHGPRADVRRRWCSSRRSFPTWRAFAPAPLDYLGDISYGIYLWHLPVILVLKAHFAGGARRSSCS